MQDIPDKDFNEAFRQKFESFEIEPSSAVWRGIVSELDNGKQSDSSSQKKPFHVFWLMTAASVLIVFSTGIWLFSPKEKIQLRGRTDNLVIQEELPADSAPVLSIKDARSNPNSTKTILTNTSLIAAVKPLESHPAEQKITERETPRLQETPVTEIEAAKTDNIVAKDEKAYLGVDQPVLALAGNPGSAAYSNLKDGVPQQPRGKTIGLGGVVNFFVEKLDPREDKLIQFRSDGDGGSAVSGINLGVFKIKSRDK